MYKKIIDGKKAIIFDLDGTIIDNETVARQAVYNIGNPLGLTHADLADTPTGMLMDDKWKYLLDNTSMEKKLSVGDLVKRTYAEYLKLFDENDIGVREGFWELASELKVDKGLKLGLVSNSARYIVDKVLERIDASQTFEITLCGDEVKRPKPDPSMYKQAAKRLGVKTSEILVFEDSIVGARAAHDAKMDMIIVWNGKTPQRGYPEGILGFIGDFTGIAGNLDTYFEEEFEVYQQKVKEQLNQ